MCPYDLYESYVLLSSKTYKTLKYILLTHSHFYMQYIICYDIVDDAPRTQISERLCAIGGIRVNKSVFEVSLSERELVDLLHHLSLWIEPKTDSIHCYPICMRCFVKKISLPAQEMGENTVQHI